MKKADYLGVGVIIGMALMLAIVLLFADIEHHEEVIYQIDGKEKRFHLDEYTGFSFWVHPDSPGVHSFELIVATDEYLEIQKKLAEWAEKVKE